MEPFGGPDDQALVKVESAHRDMAYPYGYSMEQTATNSLGDYWRVLLKRKWVFISCLIVAMTLTTVETARTKRVYEAAARINVGNGVDDILGFKNRSDNTDNVDYTVTLETQSRVLQGDSLALLVIRKLHLDQTPEFGGSPSKSSVATTLDPARETAMMKAFTDNVRVVAIPNTQLLDVHVSSTDPRMAAEIANTLVDTFIEQNIKAKYDATVKATDWLSRQLTDLQTRVESSEAKLVDYQKAHQIIGGDEKNNIITSKLAALGSELNAAEADRIQKESLYRYSADAHTEGTVAGSANDVMDKLRKEESDLKVQIGQDRVHFGPKHPKLIELRSRLQEVQSAIRAENEKSVQSLHNDYLAAIQREKLLRSAFEQQKQEANDLNQSAIEYSILKREAESNRQLYDGLLQKLKEAGLSAGVNSSNIRIVDRARVPLSPSQPNVPRNYELGLLIGLMSGLAMAFIVEAMDNTVNTFDVTETTMGLPALGLVPLSVSLQTLGIGDRRTGLLGAMSRKRAGGAEVVTLSQPRSEMAEAYRAIRTSVLFSGRHAPDKAGVPPKVLLVTSPAPGDGKTTTSVNIAVVLAQKGFRVLLVDADLRRPNVHKHFGFKVNGGLSEVLTGHRSYPAVLLTVPTIPNLSILPAGLNARQPSELLSSETMRNLLSQWRQEYDHIVIDTSPVLSVTDGVLLAADADGVALVIRSGHTTRSALRRSQMLLAQVGAKTIGIVLNAVDLRSPDYRHYYYSGYRKGYGSYYDSKESKDSK